MDVIARAVDDERGSVHLANDATEIGEKIGADLGSYKSLAAFGAEDQVNNKIAGGMSQVSFAPSELDTSFDCVQPGT